MTPPYAAEVTDETPAGPADTPATVDAARLVDQVVDYAIIALDGSGTIESWNAGAQRLKGYTADEAIGRSFSMFYSEEDRRAGLPLRLLDEARDKGRVEHLGWRVRKDGTRFWGDVIITALHNDLGDLTGFAKVTRDLTEQHELEESLRRSEERFRLARQPGPRLRDHRPRPQRDHRVVERRRRAGQGLHRRRGDRPQLLDVLHRRGPTSRAAAGAPRRGPAPGQRGAHGVAGPQGRHPLLGRRHHHRPASTTRAS